MYFSNWCTFALHLQTRREFGQDWFIARKTSQCCR